jgi:nuclear pore complex protein Nup62
MLHEHRTDLSRYKLSEKLSDRLNELNRDLTEMIEEINTTSQTLSKTGKADDPVSLFLLFRYQCTNAIQLTKVVRVLNTQLSQLQLIDSGASQLQEKIAKAQKDSQHVGANGWNGLGSDPTADFYRSFRGGRTERFGGVS